MANLTEIDVKNIGRYLKELENEKRITIRKEQDGKIRTKYVSLKKPQQRGAISKLSKNMNLFDMEQFISDKVSSEEVAILDNNSEWLGIPKSHLMECAGYSFTMEIIRRYNLNNISNSKVLIFCGTGNNGGDGFVVARHLTSFGIGSLVVLLGNPNNIRTQEAKQNWDVISNSLNYLIQIKLIKDSTDIEQLSTTLDESNGFTIIVDGLLGTGIKGNIREPVSTVIDFINNIKKIKKIPIVSIDVPSGLDPNTGIVAHKAIKSDLVITFHRNKKGLASDSEYVKEICVKSIGIPWEASLFVGRGDLIPTLKVRKIDNYKGEFGKVLVIGGSKNYSGAPAYSSLTAIHFGCDLVITYVPQVVGDVIRSYSPNMIVRTSPGDWLNLEALEEIKYLAKWSNSILIGPGLGEEKETEDLLIELLKYLNKNNKAYILDADALKLVK
ncbi:MAG: NAD(P)H-hydrate epimerase, partial [Promethearchaeota archaeon]